MTGRMEFYVPGQPFDGGTYHYVESGLDNVYLLNGFTTEEDPEYGPLVTFHNPDMMHRAIAIGIIEEGRPLTGPEFKFLRRLRKMTQAKVAEFFGVDAQTVANYEKGTSPIPKSSDTVWKAEYLLSIMPEDVRASVIKEIIERRKKRLSKAAQRDMELAVQPWREHDAGQPLLETA